MMARFEPNELQRTLFSEVMATTMPDFTRAPTTARRMNEVIKAWLDNTMPSLQVIATAAREGLRIQDYGRDAVVLAVLRTFMGPGVAPAAMALLSFPCLTDRIGPDALRSPNYLELLKEVTLLTEGL